MTDIKQRVPIQNRLALHTWTLDTTPLATTLAILLRTGWRAIELRRADFEREWSSGRSVEDTIELVHGSDLSVAAVGIRHGWMYTSSGELGSLLDIAREMSAIAQQLGCFIVMSPVDLGHGNHQQAVDRLRIVGDIVGEHGCRLALEFNSQATQFNTLLKVRSLLADASHSACGLLLDTYHLYRSNENADAIGQLTPDELIHVQYSDVPSGGLRAGIVDDRLPPGRGIIPFDTVFERLQTIGYRGFLSYEAPNPGAWAANAEDVAREARALTLTYLNA